VTGCFGRTVRGGPRRAPVAAGGDHLGGAGGVVGGLAHNAGQAAQVAVALGQRLVVADYAAQVARGHARQRQQAVPHEHKHLAHDVQPVPAHAPTHASTSWLHVCVSAPGMVS
jgi:hypothetical protein